MKSIGKRYLKKLAHRLNAKIKDLADFNEYTGDTASQMVLVARMGTAIGMDMEIREAMSGVPMIVRSDGEDY